MKTVLTILSLLALLAMALAFAVWTWSDLGEVEISAAGMTALVLGALATLALGGGLMFLVFYSSRHGHDDNAGR